MTKKDNAVVHNLTVGDSINGLNSMRHQNGREEASVNGIVNMKPQSQPKPQPTDNKSKD